MLAQLAIYMEEKVIGPRLTLHTKVNSSCIKAKILNWAWHWEIWGYFFGCYSD